MLSVEEGADVLRSQGDRIEKDGRGEMLMVAAPQVKLYSIEEYLALETESVHRNEYRNGAIVPMTGGTPAHNKLASALNALLWFSLRGKPYSIFITDQRLWIPEKDLYTYPDGMVMANPVELQRGRTDTVMNRCYWQRFYRIPPKVMIEAINLKRIEPFQRFRSIY